MLRVNCLSAVLFVVQLCSVVEHVDADMSMPPPLGPFPSTNLSDELLVIHSSGFGEAFEVLAPQFEASSSYHINATHGSSYGPANSSIPVRLAQGEVADVIILVRGSGEALIEDGLVYESSITDLAIGHIAMAVQVGAPVREIDTVEHFNNTLVKAKSIAYSDSSSGRYIETELFPMLGIDELMISKSTKASRLVGSLVARGEAELCFQQLSELKQVTGIDIVGPIPAELQLNTTFSVAIPKSSNNVKTAMKLIEFLKSADNFAVIESAGLVPAARMVATSATNPRNLNAIIV